MKEKKLMKRIFLVFALMNWIHLSYATFQSGADALINQVSPSLNIGVEVIDLTTGTTLYRRNAGQSFIPASNMKLFSDAAAILVLGPDYRFKNQLSTDATQLQQGVLKGSLYLHLSGDPSFNHERLSKLLEGLKTWKINRIQGNVYIDSSHAHVNAYPPGWLTEDLVYSYGAPLAPVMIDTNRVLITVNPAGKVEENAIVETNDASKSILIDNQVKTKPKGTSCGVHFALDADNHLLVRGCVIQGQWAIQQQMAIRNPLTYAQGLIKHQLNENNIILEGQVLLGKAPKGSLLIASETSKPVSQLMADTLKPSDNLYADSLYLHAAEKLNGSPVNWGEAQNLIKQFLKQQTGIELNNAMLVDGSGLSRQDRVTPSQTAGLLRFLYDKFPLTYEYIAALPVSGRDGTLQRRFKNPMQQDMVRAKTGTMKGIVSLSGYLFTANGHTLAFAIYINHVRGTKSSVAGRYRYVVDALCTYFLQQKPTNSSWAKVAAPHGRLKFQQNPTQAEIQRGRQARWRRLETVIKDALKGQAVTVLFRHNELILKESQSDIGKVLSALRSLQKKYSFAVALTSPTSPNTELGSTKTLNLWIETKELVPPQRIWTIREAIA